METFQQFMEEKKLCLRCGHRPRKAGLGYCHYCAETIRRFPRRPSRTIDTVHVKKGRKREEEPNLYDRLRSAELMNQANLDTTDTVGNFFGNVLRGDVDELGENTIPTFQQFLERKEKWIQKAVDPEHKGFCTPMTKKTCTPRRKALAKRFKAMGRKRKHKKG